MKKVICVLGIVMILFVGSVSVFADPWSIPGTIESTSVSG